MNSPPHTRDHQPLRLTLTCSCGLNKRVFTTSERGDLRVVEKKAVTVEKRGRGRISTSASSGAAAFDTPGLSEGGIVLYRHISCFPEGSVERLILLRSAEPY